MTPSSSLSIASEAEQSLEWQNEGEFARSDICKLRQSAELDRSLEERQFRMSDSPIYDLNVDLKLC
jgi:hypothetical protein